MTLHFGFQPGRVCLSVLAVACLAAAGAPREPVAPISTLVPNPLVLGPIPADAPPGDVSHDYPFFSTPIDLESHGYIEEASSRARRRATTFPLPSHSSTRR